MNLLFLLSSGIAGAQTGKNSQTAAPKKLADMRLLALGRGEGIAVLQSPDKKLITVRVGEKIAGTQATVLEVHPDKLVLQEMLEAVHDQQIIWMFKSGAGGVGRIERYSSAAPAPASVTAQSITTLIARPNPKGEANSSSLQKPSTRVQ